MQLYKSRLDIISIAASAACALHCIVLPIFVTTLPFLGIEIMENDWIELLTLSFTFFIGGWAIYRGYKRFHQSKGILYLFVVGVCFLIASNLSVIIKLETPLKSFGAFFVVMAHIRNWESCRACACSVCVKKENVNE
jgi:hypothetical protein